MLLRRGDPLWRIAAVLTIGITWAGLLPSFSQSSFVALMARSWSAASSSGAGPSLLLVAAGVVALIVAIAVVAAPSGTGRRSRT